jgi:acetolactate decarboxylase
VIEEKMIRSLHVEAMRSADMHAGHEPHALFQASTIGALLDGAYDGDVTFAELALRGDTGIGTLNGLDGEMIALDGQFLRADAEGGISEVAPNAYTPFAIVVEFEPTVRARVPGPLDLRGLEEFLDEKLPSQPPAAAIRIDGDFRSVTARSVPKQSRPYRPLEAVIAEQNVFRIGPTKGTLVGFRFPVWAEGIEVGGYHLHFVDDSRTRGGHVLDMRLTTGSLRAEPSSELQVELPPGVDLGSEDAAGRTHEAIEKAERLQDEEK